MSYYLPDFGRRTVTKTNSFYVQDSLTRGRLTLQGALRYDRASSYAPSELNGTTNTSFLNPQPITIPLTPGVDAYNDITPRVGVAYDVFGNGRTALKFNWGKYLAYAANDSPYTATNPGATVVRNVQNRGWTDIDNDKVVDCDLLNPALNGECAAATGTAPTSASSAPRRQVDPGVLSGWGVRPGDTQYTVTLQQELMPRLSARGQLHASQLQRVLRHRRPQSPRRRRGVVLRVVHADGAERFASGGRRWLSGHGLRAR